MPDAAICLIYACLLSSRLAQRCQNSCGDYIGPAGLNKPYPNIRRRCCGGHGWETKAFIHALNQRIYCLATA
jgi:hypothetical protein